MADKKKGCDGQDVLHMGPPNEKGFQPFIRHDADHRISTGVVKRVKDGEPLLDGAMLLEAREGEPGAFNVLNVYRTEGSGPPKVNSNEYREGWDRIFGGTQPVGQA